MLAPLLLPVRALGWLHRNVVRPRLPATRPVLHAGLASTFDWRAGDGILPRRFRPPEIDDAPDYEDKLVIAMKEHIRPGDRVVVVGGGGGTTAALAAKLVGASLADLNAAGPNTTNNVPLVICYEPSRKQLPIVKECCRRNGVADRVDVRHAAVGDAIAVYGGFEAGLTIVAPEEIPTCDVLELDCEGAERIILDRIVQRPRVIIVETHGVYGAPTNAVTRQLETIGYAVSQRGHAETRFADECEKGDIRVVVGTRREDVAG